MFTMEITRLIERCRQGDADALGELYKAYAQRMRGVCRRYISDEQTVEDVLHDAFVIIFTSFDRLRDDRRAEPWMKAITRNVASKCKNHLEALPTVSLEETSEAELITAEDEERDVRGMPLSEVVRLIDRLPEGYGQVFRLSAFEGMTHKEIADMLGIEPHSSSSQLARAKKMLRKMMQQYWAALFLLLLIPITLFLFREEDAAVKEEDGGEHQPSVVVTKQKETPKESWKDASANQSPVPIVVDLPVQIATAPVTDIQSLGIVQLSDSVMVDTLLNKIAQEQMITESTVSDSAKSTRKREIPNDDFTDIGLDKPATETNGKKKWSLELAYAGQLGEQNRYNQPFIFKPVSADVQSLPSSAPTIPSSIDNWTDYAVYLANNPGAVSEKARSAIMNIALNNADDKAGTGTDKIVRTSHHQMPVTWSLALKYRLNNRFGIETGLRYSHLKSEYEMGFNGNTINELQTIHYLGFPVKGIYNMYSGQQWSFYGTFGLTTDIPVRSVLYSDYFVNGQFETTDKTTFHAPWQFSTIFGLGLQFYLTPKVGFFVEPSLQYYIPMKTDVETYRTEHPFTFSLPLGIRFTW